jgi:hypothetical protein
MPKRKELPPKRPIDMTSDELARIVFPPEAIAELKRIAGGEQESDGGSNSAQPKNSGSP